MTTVENNKNASEEEELQQEKDEFQKELGEIIRKGSKVSKADNNRKIDLEKKIQDIDQRLEEIKSKFKIYLIQFT